MSILARTADCELLDAGGRTVLSAEQLERLVPAQRALLSPLDHPDLDSWRAASLRAIARAVGGDAGAFELRLPDEPPETDFGMPADRFGEWSFRLPETPEGVDIPRRMEEEGVGTWSILWKECLSWFSETEYFNDFLRGVGGYDPLFLATAVPDVESPANLRVDHSSPDGSRFGAEELEMMRLLRPAFEAGVRTVAGVLASRTALTASIDAQRDGALVYDLEGRLLHRNPAVHAMAATRRDDRALVVVGRQMTEALASPEDHDLLTPSSVRRSVETRHAEYDLHAVRLGEGTFLFRPAVLVTVSAGPRPLPDRRTLQDRFGLTRRQSEVALLLARRLTDPEIAERLCISPHTARSHSEAVLGKLGLSDRREVGATLRGVA